MFSLWISCDNSSEVIDDKVGNQENTFTKTSNILSARTQSTDIKNEVLLIDQNYTDLFHDLGVVGISKTNSSTVLQFNFTTEKEFVFKGVRYDLKDYVFSVVNNELLLGDLKVAYVDNVPNLIDGNSTTEVNSITYDNIGNRIDKMVILLAFDEIMSTYPKSDFSTYNKLLGNRPCAWWNTVTVLGMGTTSGAAQSDLYYATIQAVNDGTLHNCVSLGGVTETNLGFIKLARQAFCCP